MGEQAALRVCGVTKSYGRERPTLAGVDLEVAKGTVVALTGINGCGKSTLLRCIAGLATFEGRIEIAGVGVSNEADFRTLVGYLPQSVQFPPNATVRETLTFFARLRQTDPGEIPLPSGFLPRPGARVGSLSGGQRQRLSLAIALLGAPGLLLLDEPVANLDTEGRQAVWDVLHRLRSDGTATLIASPSPSDVAGVADRTILIEDGRTAEDRRHLRAVCAGG